MRVFDQDLFVPDTKYELVVDFGLLEPGFYRITLNSDPGIGKLMKRTIGLIDNIGPVKEPLKFRVLCNSENPEPKFYGFVNKKSNFSYHLLIHSREAYLKEHPTLDSINTSEISYYGKDLDNNEYYNYPDCKFINDMSPSGHYHLTIDVDKLHDVV